MSTNIHYVAELKDVREISLTGTADLGYWKDRLAAENLVPVDYEGKAKILVSSIDSKFMKIRFREMVFAVFVNNPGAGSDHGAAYLGHAFNSSKLFAFIERNVFSTPYYLGQIHLDLSLPASMNVVTENQMVFRARMSADADMAARKPARSKYDLWRGALYLPTRPGKKPKMFWAKIGGHTDYYPFVEGDVITIKPRSDQPMLQALVDSGFVGEEWCLREAAAHAKSKTVARR